MLDRSFTDSYQPSGMSIPCDVVPSTIPNKDFYNGQDVSRIFWRGCWCPLCGKLNSRVLWAGWECSNCRSTTRSTRRVYNAQELRDPFRPTYTGPPILFDWKNPRCNVKTDVAEHPTIRITRYFLGSDVGTVHHIACSDRENQRADELFLAYQTQNIDLRRRLLKTKVEGYMLSAQFSHNAGVKYKYHVETGTESFDDCAPAILEARDLITEKVQLALAPQLFNEILSVAYFEGQQMGYHDDGETGVSSVVASLSLGSPATMKFRPKRGRESLFFDGLAGVADVGDAMDEQQVLQEDDDEGYVDTTSATIHEKTPSHKSFGRDILRLHLEHGDIMIMQGQNFQRLVEHSVVPKGFRIAATARHIAGPGVTTRQNGDSP